MFNDMDQTRCPMFPIVRLHLEKKKKKKKMEGEGKRKRKRKRTEVAGEARTRALSLVKTAF